MVNNAHENVVPRKVWMISAGFYPDIGGGQIQLQRLSKKLIAKGLSINVLTRRHIRGYENLPSRDVVDRIPIIRLFSKGKGRIGSIFFLSRVYVT